VITNVLPAQITNTQEDYTIQILRILKKGQARVFLWRTDIFMQQLKILEKAELCKALLTSNEPSYVKHFMSIFEEMWKNSLDTRDAIRKVEEGVDPNEIEPHIPYDEKDTKDYLNEVLKEIGRIRDSHRLPS
jgi:hypothetical protein